MLHAHRNAIQYVRDTVGKWMRLSTTLDRPIERCVAASCTRAGEPAVWLGFDGLDEISPDDLSSLCNEIAGFVQTNPNVRFVLTSRRKQIYNYLTGVLNAHGRIISVPEFNEQEASLALFQATNGQLDNYADNVRSQFYGSSSSSSPKVRMTTEFADSLRQPIFVGVIRRVFQNDNGANTIMSASEGDQEALNRIAEEYMYIFCERAVRRLSIYDSDVDCRTIFRTIKELTQIGYNTTKFEWDQACEANMSRLIDGNKFFRFCVSSGILNDNSEFESIEWRHPFIARSLSNMQEALAWI